MGRRKKAPVTMDRSDNYLLHPESLQVNLLVTMGARAGYMSSIEEIELPAGSAGEDELAIFVAKKIEEYMQRSEDSDINFDEYIEVALKQEYGGRT